jgi:hypothetical protein
MGVGASIVLIAVGGILAWAVSAEIDGVNLNMVGIILLVVGAIGLLLSLIFWPSWGASGPWRRETVVRDDVYERRL